MRKGVYNVNVDSSLIKEFNKSEFYRYLEGNGFEYYISKISRSLGIEIKRIPNLRVKNNSYEGIVDLNYEIIKSLYADKQFIKLLDKNTLRNFLFNNKNRIYRDPDNWLEKKCVVNNKEIILSADGLITAKNLFDLHEGTEKWIEEYVKYRRRAYVFFPKHGVSINQQRYTIFNDRIDYTLFDIKHFYQLRKSNCEDEVLRNAVMDQQNGCKLAKALVKDETLIWLNNFNSFEEFIDLNYGHHKFVEMQNGEYSVLDLEVGNGEIIRSYKNNGYKMDLTSIDNYYKNLFDLME